MPFLGFAVVRVWTSKLVMIYCCATWFPVFRWSVEKRSRPQTTIDRQFSIDEHFWSQTTIVIDRRLWTPKSNHVRGNKTLVSTINYRSFHTNFKIVNKNNYLILKKIIINWIMIFGFIPKAIEWKYGLRRVEVLKIPCIWIHVT